MNNKLFSSLLLLVMLIYFTSYGVYTGIRFFYSPYKTETAFMYTISDSFTADAVAVRDERLISHRIDENDHISYTREDGEVVVSGSVVANLYNDEDQLDYRAEIARYQSEIELLKKAEQSANQFLAAEGLSNQVNDIIGNIVESVSESDLDSIKADRDKLQLVMGRHRVAVGRDKNFSNRINKLEDKVSSVSKKLTNDHEEITVDEGGYFCSKPDGYETILTTNLNAVSVEQYRKIINGSEKVKPSDKAGKVQVGHDWFFAIAVNSEDIHRFKEGAMVDIDVKVSGGTSIPASVHEIMTDENGDAIVFLKTNYVSESLITLRRVKIEIKFKSFSGLRISTNALRYDGLVEGVYVKNDKLVSFKEIKRIYTGEDYILCLPADKLDPEEENLYPPLKQFDEVIVEGTDLYDGKVL